MSDLTDDLLNNVDIVDVVWRYVNLKRIGKNFSGLCPFHREKTPSFTVAPDKQIYKCFGCGAGWNAIKFVMEVEKADFWDAIKILSKYAGIDISKYNYNATKHEKSVWEKEKLKLLNKHALNFFVENLKSSKTAHDYLTNNRKLSQDIIDKFSLGYAPDSHYELVKFLKSKGFDDHDIQQAWLGNKGSTNDLYSFFRNRIIFPIWDHMWNIVSFAWRSIVPEDMPKYLNITQTPLYDKSKVLYWLHIVKNHIKEFDSIIVVEWYMDVIALNRLETPIGVATCGTALTQWHIKLLKRYTQNIIFAFDNDEAWFNAIQRWLKACYEEWIFPKVLIIEWSKDLDEIVNTWWEFDLSNNVDAFDFILDKLKIKLNMQSATERKNILETMFDIVSSIQDYSVVMFYLEKISKSLSMNFDVLFRQFKTYLSWKRTYWPVSEKPKKDIEDKYFLLSVFYNNFLKSNNFDNSWVNELIEIIKTIIGYTDQTLFNKVINDELEEDEKQKILEAQIWWEKQFDASTSDKKLEILVNYLKNQINEFTKHIIKLSNLSEEDKHNIFLIRKKITKI